MESRPPEPAQPRDDRPATAIDDLVARCLERMERDGDRALGDVCASHPDLAGELRTRIARLEKLGMLGLTRQRSTRGVPERLGDFRLIEPLGEGGMGVVFRAEQISLGRLVALKVIRPESLFFSGARERFRREVDAVARLAYPGIVPVYTVGEDAGVPYFAMELVAGASLAEAIAHFKERDPGELRGDDLRGFLRGRDASSAASSSASSRIFSGAWTDCCVAIAREVALALEHAHERGVLHRDVKPSNVMLTSSGRVVLLDFGLAALQGSDRLTRSGAMLGSLAYMAPEQIEGDADAIGVRTDVYGLGVTLYELLALRPPYQHERTEALARLVVEGKPPALRSRDSAVSIDVETVCLTAMERDPERRYASAVDLAADLASVLEKRPIRARRAGPWLRARRWSQRHPGWAASIGLAAFAIVVAPWWVAASERRTRLAVAEERDRAESNLKHALAAIDVLTRIGEHDLAEVEQADGARRLILEAALAFHERLVGQRSSDPRATREVALAAASAASIQALLGDRSAAERELRRAIDDLERLGARDDATHASLARARTELAQALQARDALDEAEALASQGATEIAEIASRAPEIATAADVARARRRAAEIRRRMGRGAEACAEIERAIAALDAALAADPDDQRAARARAEALATLGAWRSELHDPAARAVLERARNALDEVLARSPRDPRARQIRSRTLQSLGEILSSADDVDGAKALLDASLADAESLARDYPRVPGYREQEALSLVARGIARSRAGDVPGSLLDAERAESILAELVRDHPDTSAYALSLRGVRTNLVPMYTSSGRAEDARALAVRALAEARATLEKTPGDPNARRSATYLQINLAQALLQLARLDECVAEATDLPFADTPMEIAFAAGVVVECVRAGGPRADAWRTRAFELLERAVSKGWSDVDGLRTSSAFEPLRDDPRFQKIVEAVAAAKR